METIRLQFAAKNNLILKEMERLGMTRKEFAAYLEIHPCSLSSLISMNFMKPNGRRTIGLKTIKRVSSLIGYSPETLFPNWAVYVAKYVNSSQLELNDNAAKMILDGACANSGSKQLNDNDLKADINRVLHTLTSQQADTIKYYFGLDGHDEMTIKELSDKMHLSSSRIGEIVRKALISLRHGARSTILTKYIELKPEPENDE